MVLLPKSPKGSGPGPKVPKEEKPHPKKEPEHKKVSHFSSNKAITVLVEYY